MIWASHLAIGVTESGYYSIRRCTYDYEIWFKNSHNHDFRLISRSPTLTAAKHDAEQHKASYVEA